MASHPKILLIAIEGSIGVGKSTVVNRLKGILGGKMGISFVDEPVDEWIEHGFLQGMYDGSINSAVFQHMVLQSLAGDLLKTIAKDKPAIIISERSVVGNYHVFGKATLTGMNLSMYEFTWKRVLEGMPEFVDTRYIYLDAPAETVMQRMNARGRESETSIDFEYMKKIVDLHEEWLSSESNVARVDASRDEDTVFQTVCDVVGQWAMKAASQHVASRPLPVEHHKEVALAHEKSEEACNNAVALLVAGV
jgi:deoxyadenosine/deoxycytidine kinase